jgi:antitoxin CptB
MDAQQLNRLRWQCRRGLLELDVVLEGFLVRYGEQLQGERLASFEILLDYADNELLDVIHARAECRDARLAELVQWMRDCRDRTGAQCSANGKEDDDGVHS